MLIISTCSDSSSIQEVPSVHVQRLGLLIVSLTFLSLWIFTKLMDVIAAHLHQRTISLFPYLDDRLMRYLMSNRLISHTIYCLQTVQSLGFIPNLKKSDLIPDQKFTFIGMEFPTQQNIVGIPADRIDSLLLTIKMFLSQTQISHELSFLFWANSVQRQTLLS